MKKTSFTIALLAGFVFAQACTNVETNSEASANTTAVSDVATNPKSAPMKTATADIGSSPESMTAKADMMESAATSPATPAKEMMDKAADANNTASAKEVMAKVSNPTPAKKAKEKVETVTKKVASTAKKEVTSVVTKASASVSNSAKTVVTKVQNTTTTVPAKKEMSNAAEAATPPAKKEMNDVAEAPSHAAFSGLLKQHVVGAKVDYAGFKKDQAILKKYLAMLAENAPQDSWKRNEKLAYWINAYNATTINLLLDNYPVSTIKDINNGKPWDMKVVTLGDKTYTLNEIENGIIRPTFGEPRIHFAVNCAAKSCPPIRNEAFVASRLDAQLEEQTKDFLNDKTYNYLEGSTFHASSIFDWYGKDFGDVKAFIGKYTTIPGNATIVFDDYDWSLNKQ